MIVAERKPLPEIMEMVKDYKRILVAGCGTCVAVCLAGGEKEARITASQLMLAAGMDGADIEAFAATVERQCDREFLELFREHVAKADAVVSLACGAGIQFLGEMYPDTPVFPGVDTSFIGVAEGAGEWTERCRSCNQCYLALTGGICPVTMCAKGLLNGPCGGSVHGKCETDPEKDCAWIKIFERLERQSRIDAQEAALPPIRNDRCAHPGRVEHPAYRRRFQSA